MKPMGAFNVAKCVQYLRHVNIEVSGEQEQSWLDAEKVHRYLRRIRRPVREVAQMQCSGGHDWYGETKSTGKGKKRREREARLCPECGQEFAVWQLVWTESPDGTVKDWRPQDEHWRPLPLGGNR